MSRSSAFGAKEARVKPSREQVNLCGACGTEISATELLCKECRGTMGRVEPLFEGGSDASVGHEWGSGIR